MDLLKKNSITFANFLGIMTIIIIPLLVWAITLETRLTLHENKIETNERLIYKIEDKLDNLQNTSTRILIELQRKDSFAKIMGVSKNQKK